MFKDRLSLTREAKRRLLLILPLALGLAFALHRLDSDPREAYLLFRYLIFIPLSAVGVLVILPLIWRLCMVLGRPVSPARRHRLRWGVIVVAYGLLLAAFYPSLIDKRRHRKCSEVQKNWTVACGSLNSELDVIDRVNKSKGYYHRDGRQIPDGMFTGKHAALYVIWFYTGVGQCPELVPGFCDNQKPEDWRAPFMPELPAYVYGIENIVPRSGQVAIEENPNDNSRVIVYRDLTWAPFCGETKPIVPTIGGDY